jgi:hypothetical protein
MIFAKLYEEKDRILQKETAFVILIKLPAEQVPASWSQSLRRYLHR